MYIRLLYLAFRIYTFIFRPIITGVRVMLVQDGQALLVRHTYLEGWYMPGGGVTRRESPVPRSGAGKQRNSESKVS